MGQTSTMAYSNIKQFEFCFQAKKVDMGCNKYMVRKKGSKSKSSKTTELNNDKYIINFQKNPKI